MNIETSPSVPAIRCADLVKEYHTQATVRALDGLDMEIREGEILERTARDQGLHYR